MNHRFTAGIVDSWPAEREAPLPELRRPPNLRARHAGHGGDGGGTQVDGVGEERQGRAATAAAPPSRSQAPPPSRPTVSLPPSRRRSRPLRCPLH
jgi:hypothetical protein